MALLLRALVDLYPHRLELILMYESYVNEILSHDVCRSLTSLLCVVVQTTTSVKAYRNGGPGDGVQAGDAWGSQLIPAEIF